jgi:RNA polymerase sigma-70 factor (ECF subfamily)
VDQPVDPETTRPSLLSRVRDPGDHAAWAEFEARYRDLIFRYCRRVGLAAADAEDVRQMVMLRLVRILPKFRYDPTRGRFHDYLYRVVRSAIADFRSCPDSRTNPVVNEEPLEAPVAAMDGPYDPSWEQEWLDHHLRLALAAVRQTSEVRSVAVFERLLAGTSVEQAATEFGMTLDAVHKVKQRLRDRVQQRIAEQIREEDTIDG